METKGVTCKIPLDLHNRISEEIRETESTMSKFIEMIIQEHYEKGAGKVMAKGRTLAFQVSEELFQRVKEYLERFEKVHHRRLTQKEFIIGLIEQALEEAEEEFEAAEAAGREEQEESAWDAAQGGETGEGDDPSTGSPANTPPGAPHRRTDRKRRMRTRKKLRAKRLSPRMPLTLPKLRKPMKKSTHKRNNSSPQDWVHPNPCGLFSYRLTLHHERGDAG